MRKPDTSIKNITIASIKRHTMKPFNFKYSDIYENDRAIQNERVRDLINLENGEELICSTIVNDSIWSVLTTRRIITLEGVGKVEHYLSGLKRRDAGDFKGYSKQEYTKGFLHFDDDKVIPYFIETGEASMIMIYGVNTTTQQL